MVHLKFIMFFKCSPVRNSQSRGRGADGLKQNFAFVQPKWNLPFLGGRGAEGGVGRWQSNCEKAETFFIISKYVSAWSFSTTEN